MTLYTGDPDYAWHNSAFRALRTCEQKWTYRYVDGLKRDPLTVSVPLLRGSWFHALMQAQGLKQGMLQGTLLEPVGETIDLGFDAPHDEVYVAPLLVGDTVSPLEVHRYLIEHVWDYIPHEDDDANLPDEVWSLYQRYLHAHVDTLVHEEVLAVEVEWQRRDSDGVLYQGKVDRIVRRPDGLVILRDHKTTSRKPASDFRLIDSQLHLYAWGVAPFLDEHGITPDAVEYDYAITRKVPDVKLTKAGNLYKTSQGADYFSMKMGLIDLGEDPNDEKWAAALEQGKENIPDFFSRNLMPVNTFVIGNLLRENDMLRARANDIAVMEREPIRSTGMQCDWCDFATICSGDMYGNDTTILKKEMQ